MLRLYRRHRRACRQTSERYRRCTCPIYVEGTLAGEYVRKALDLTSWEAATDLAGDWNASGQIGVVRPEIPTIAEAVEKFLADAKARLKEPSVKKYRNILDNRLVPFCARRGLTRLKQLNVEQLRDFRAGWNDAPRTHQKNLEFLRCFLRFCEEAEWIPKNPARALKSPKVDTTPTLPFTPAEVQKLLDGCGKYNGNGPRLRAMVLLLRYSGLRISDAARLAREQICGDRIFLYQQKTGTPVYVPVPKCVTDALAQMPGTNYVFWSGNGKEKSAIEDWRRSFTALANLAGVSNAHFHRLRDSFAVALLEKGVDIETVAVLLGHSSSAITRRHYNPWVKSRQEQLEVAVRKTWQGAA